MFGGGMQVPVPPPELMQRVAGTDDPGWFDESGRRSLADIRSVLAFSERDISDAERVLDFGCGCGRVLRHLHREADAGTEIVGVDTDAEAIEWVRAHLPYVYASPIEPLPPLPFPDGHFDLVINHSVFSHLPEDYQDAWLTELHRVARPGAWLELTVHGVHAFENLCHMLDASGRDTAQMRREFAEQGFLYVRDESWEGTFPDYYQNAYHSPSYIFEHWGRTFDVKVLVARGALDFQDIVLLRRAE
jgi:SAM-dependent methyltransferase